MQTTNLNQAVIVHHHADLRRNADEWRRGTPRRKRQRMAIVTGGRYFANGGSGKRGELHRAGA